MSKYSGIVLLIYATRPCCAKPTMREVFPEEINNPREQQNIISLVFDSSIKIYFFNHSHFMIFVSRNKNDVSYASSHGNTCRMASWWVCFNYIIINIIVIIIIIIIIVPIFIT